MDVQEEIQQPEVPVTEQPEPHKNNKKALIVGGVIVLCLLLVGLSLFSHRNTPTTSQKAGAPTPQHKIPLASAVSPHWYTIKTQYYAVSVPEGWKPQAEPMQGGVSMIVRPQNTEEDPILVVEAYTTPVSIQKKVNLFRAMGLKQEGTVSNSQPVMLSGTWPTRTINSRTFKTPTQERVVYIPHGDSLYGVKLYYSSPHPEKVYDDMLQKVLESFTSAS